MIQCNSDGIAFHLLIGEVSAVLAEMPEDENLLYMLCPSCGRVPRQDHDRYGQRASIRHSRHQVRIRRRVHQMHWDLYIARVHREHAAGSPERVLAAA